MPAKLQLHYLALLLCSNFILLPFTLYIVVTDSMWHKLQQFLLHPEEQSFLHAPQHASTGCSVDYTCRTPSTSLQDIRHRNVQLLQVCILAYFKRSASGSKVATVREIQNSPKETISVTLTPHVTTCH